MSRTLTCVYNYSAVLIKDVHVRGNVLIYMRRFAQFVTICTIKKREKHSWRSVIHVFLN